MATIAELSIFPLDKGQSVGMYIARVLEVIEKSGMDYRLGAMGTCIEGEFERVMEVIGKCHEVLAADCERIYCVIKMDTRKGHQNMMEGKVRSVEEKVGRALKR